MKFGAYVPQGWRHDLVDIPVDNQWSVITEVARTLEGVGFDSLWVYDHFLTVPVPTQNSTFEAWTVIAALAAETRSIRLGQMCTSVTYRNPAYLAKIAATVDVISAGRVDVGLGAGWAEKEHRAYGYAFPSAHARCELLDETALILRRMWSEEVVDYDGTHYSLEGAICQPKPIQNPHPPIWIAGGGERLTLKAAASHADYTNFGNTLEGFVHKSEVLQGHCDRIGRNFSTITRSASFKLFCTETQAEAGKRIRWYQEKLSHHMSTEKAREMASRSTEFSGPPERIVPLLEGWMQAGMSYAIVNFPDAAYDTSGLERFAQHVIPALSGQFPAGG